MSVNSVAVVLTILLGSSCGTAAYAQPTLQQIQSLESQLFEARLPADRLTSLLDDLENPDQRDAAKAELSRAGLLHISSIIEFARHCDDLEGRQACADIVETLDALYKTTSLGKQLQELYRQREKELLPDYWQRFRRDPNDHRAVAFLTAIDAETTYRWLQKRDGADRHDSIRYLLLRLRELVKDQFVLDHLFEHSGYAVLLVAQDVFPHIIRKTPRPSRLQNVGDGIRFVAAHRYVGHVVVKPFTLWARLVPEFNRVNKGFFQLKDWPADQPFIGGAVIYKEWVGVCRHESAADPDDTKAVLLPVEPLSYTNNHGQLIRVNGELKLRPPEMQQGLGRFVRPYTIDYLPQGLYPVPRVHLEKPFRSYGMPALPSWAKSLVTTRYRKYVRSRRSSPRGPMRETAKADDRDRGKFDLSQLPEFASTDKKPIPADAVSVVILPPRVSLANAKDDREFAEAIADHLAAGLEEARIARVVNRQDIGIILKERALAKDSKGPLLAYDLMVRFDVQVEPELSRAALTVFELSTGNPLATAELPWPLRKQEFAAALETCETAVRNYRRPAKSRLKLRLLGVENASGGARIDPLVRRLDTVLRDSLEQSKQIKVVRHLAAITSQEESLLLYAGLSRLADGRVFSPQADATLELRVKGDDVVGIEFSKTPVEIGVRLWRQQKVPAKWGTFPATIGEFDQIVLRVWQDIARDLKEIPPQAADDVLANLETRRRQAERELDIVERILKSPSRNPQEMQESLQRAAAAVKLDPTSERARYLYLRAPRSKTAPLQNSERPMRRRRRRLAEMRQYYEMFGTSSPHSTSVMNLAMRLIRPVRKLSYLRPDHPDYDDAVAILFESKQILDGAYAVDGRRFNGELGQDHGYGDITDSVEILYHGLRSVGQTVEESEAWLDQLISHADKHVQDWMMTPEGKKSPPSFRVLMNIKSHARLLTVAADLAFEEGRYERARQLIQAGSAVIKPYPPKAPGKIDFLQSVCRIPLRRAATGFDDREFSDHIDRELGLVRKLPARFLSVRLLEPQQMIRSYTKPHELRFPVEMKTEVAYTTATSNHQHPLLPLISHGDQLYLLVRSNDVTRFASLPLDADGRPQGKLTTIRRFRKTSAAITFLPEPPLHKPGSFRVTGVHYWNEKIYFGTTSNGLLIWDPLKKIWSVFGPEQGLPEWTVDSFFPIDKDTLFCTSRTDRQAKRPIHTSHYTLDAKTGNVKIIHQVNDRESRYLHDYRFESIWKNSETWMGWSGRGLVGDLFSKKPTRNYDRPNKYHLRASDWGRYLSSVAEVGERRFTLRNRMLSEFAGSGKLLRSWKGTEGVYTLPIPFKTLSTMKQWTTGTKTLDVHPFFNGFSYEGVPLARVGSCLAVSTSTYVTVYDPQKELWHGPFAMSGCNYLMGTHLGLWMFSDSGGKLFYVALKDIIEVGKKSGRMNTFDGYRERRWKYIKSLPDKQQAFGWIVEKQFPQAQKLLLKVLQEKPNDAETLLALGFLCEVTAVASHTEAEQYFQQLADHSERQAACTGMWWLIHYYNEHGRWGEAREAIDRFVGRYEIDRYMGTELDTLRKKIDSKRPR